MWEQQRSKLEHKIARIFMTHECSECGTFSRCVKSKGRRRLARRRLWEVTRHRRTLQPPTPLPGRCR
ncbi:hypothetical protein E2C01_049151 [Portunus trituberculatus]|uniref:Uncharacterized protein n=1 Tax=Portunus trituberculatus TaxID=210409 RepID=A0A5B7GC36_PORTR|nr:hypothetical protein [Portunus trituberculatus]